MSNKVKFGLKNVHVAALTKTLDEQTGLYTYSYGTPKRIYGAVNLSLDAQGDTEAFYADNIVYYRSTVNNGYSGTLEVALLPDWFNTDILGEVKDDNNVFVEKAETVPVNFALLFEFTGDVKSVRHVLYNCTATRPSLSSKTSEETVTPLTETLTLSADPREDGLIKAKTGEDTTTATYSNWYSEVYEPDAAESAAKLTALTIGSLTLTPTFDDEVVAYTTATTNTSDTVTATGESGSTVTVTVNGVAHTSGTAAEWAAGNNTVAVTVSRTGCADTTYLVTVVKS